jgi:hypothetical protein
MEMDRLGAARGWIFVLEMKGLAAVYSTQFPLIMNDLRLSDSARGLGPTNEPSRI